MKYIKIIFKNYVAASFKMLKTRDFKAFYPYCHNPHFTSNTHLCIRIACEHMHMRVFVCRYVIEGGKSGGWKETRYNWQSPIKMYFGWWCGKHYGGQFVFLLSKALAYSEVFSRLLGTYTLKNPISKTKMLVTCK